MKYKIPALDTPEACRTPYAELGVHRLVSKAYFFSDMADNELINFDDYIFEEDVSGIIGECRKQKIREFTISSTYSGMVRIIALFVEKGCTLEGMVTVNDSYRDPLSGERRTLPAFKLSVD